MKNFNGLVGKRISELRKACGMTQAELAELADLEVETISRLESGNRNMNLASLNRITQALGVELKDFFDFRSPVAKTVPSKKLLRIYRLLEKLPEAKVRKIYEIVRMALE